MKTNYPIHKTQRYRSILVGGSFFLAITLNPFQVFPKVHQPFESSFFTAYPPEAIIVPNTFTPNNDGINDEFKVNLNGNIVVNYNLSIFTKWGVLIFNTKNANINWDGRTTSGLKATEGTYFYVLDVNDVQYKGSLTLLE